MRWSRAKLTEIILLYVAICLLCGCTILPSPSISPSMGDKPRRIVSLTPANTEILFMLEAGPHVVGVTEQCEYPPEATARPRVGSFFSPDIERIVALEPDLVVAGGDVHARQIALLKKIGIPVLSVEPHTLQQVLEGIVQISTAIQEPDKGQILAQRLKDEWELVRAKDTSGQRSPGVFMEIWPAPLLTVGARSYISDLLLQAGGHNVAAGRKRDYFTCDLELLYHYNPDVYVIVNKHDQGQRLENLHKPEFLELQAVKNGRVVVIEEDLILRPGPRTFQGLTKLADILREVTENT